MRSAAGRRDRNAEFAGWGAGRGAGRDRVAGRLAVLDHRPYNEWNHSRTAFIYLFETENDRDVSRGLLTFAEAKPLGERGYFWLRVHLANLFGHAKLTLDDRVAWVDAHMDDVEDAAAAPLDGRRFWLGADDPWQALAACFEISSARAHSGTASVS